MSSAPGKISHLLLLAIPAWGHVRPLLVLATRLVLEREDIVITVLLASTVIKKAHSDISNQFRNAGIDVHARRRIRLVSIFNAPDSMTRVSAIAIPFGESYASIYDALLQSRPLTCVTTGMTFDALPPPITIILDLLGLPQLQATRSRTGRSIPVVGFVAASAASILRGYGPPGMGGHNRDAKISSKVERTGKAVPQIGAQAIRDAYGSIVKIPGLPGMYSHEFSPQPLPYGGSYTAALMNPGHLVFRDCDAVIVHTFDAYDNSGSLSALKSLLVREGKNLYAIGPLLPLGYGVDDLSSRGDDEVEAFMENMLRRYGRRSVTLISFGTIFWPSIPGYLEEVIDAFIEKKAPFFLCHSSPLSKLSPEFIEKVRRSGLGYTSPWAPQQYLLNHPATGWFLTHGGQGSVTEALGSGIPMICWPFMGDQPISAAHLTQNLNVAVELIEVRTGDKGLKPMLRYGRAPKGTREAVATEIRDVIDACRGGRGKELRRNAEDMKAAFADSWREGGGGRAELQAFLAKYVRDRTACTSNL